MQKITTLLLIVLFSLVFMNCTMRTGHFTALSSKNINHSNLGKKITKIDYYIPFYTGIKFLMSGESPFSSTDLAVHQALDFAGPGYDVLLDFERDLTLYWFFFGMQEIRATAYRSSDFK